VVQPELQVQAQPTSCTSCRAARHTPSGDFFLRSDFVKLNCEISGAAGDSVCSAQFFLFLGITIFIALRFSVHVCVR